MNAETPATPHEPAAAQAPVIAILPQDAQAAAPQALDPYGLYVVNVQAENARAGFAEVIPADELQAAVAKNPGATIFQIADIPTPIDSDGIKQAIKDNVIVKIDPMTVSASISLKGGLPAAAPLAPVAQDVASMAMDAFAFIVKDLGGLGKEVENKFSDETTAEPRKLSDIFGEGLAKGEALLAGLSEKADRATLNGLDVHMSWLAKPGNAVEVDPARIAATIATPAAPAAACDCGPVHKDGCPNGVSAAAEPLPTPAPVH
jgi:hypothetical protein